MLAILLLGCGTDSSKADDSAFEGDDDDDDAVGDDDDDDDDDDDSTGLPVADLAGCTVTIDEYDGDALEDRTVIDHDDDGRPVHEEWDYAVDGDIDEVIETTWHGSGQELLVEIDGLHDSDVNTVADGVLDEVYEYTIVGGLRVMAEYDDDADGQVDRIATYTYDDEDYVQTVFIEDANGTLSSSADFLWTADRLRVDVLVDADGDGTFDSASAYTEEYDAEGRIIRFQSLSVEFEYFYEEHRLARLVGDVVGLDSEWVYTYDDDGYLDVITLTRGAPANDVSTEEHYWSCP